MKSSLTHLTAKTLVSLVLATAFPSTPGWCQTPETGVAAPTKVPSPTEQTAKLVRDFSDIIKFVVEDMSRQQDPKDASEQAPSADLAYKMEKLRKLAESNMIRFTEELQTVLLPEVMLQVAAYNSTISQMPNSTKEDKESRKQVKNALLHSTEERMKIISRKYGQMLLKLYDTGDFNPVALVYRPRTAIPSQWVRAFVPVEGEDDSAGWSNHKVDINVQDFVAGFLYPKVIRRDCFTKNCIIQSTFQFIRFVRMIDSKFAIPITFTLFDKEQLKLTPDFTVSESGTLINGSFDRRDFVRFVLEERGGGVSPLGTPSCHQFCHFAYCWLRPSPERLRVPSPEESN